MKKTKHLFTALLLLCATVVSAHDFVADGIYYNIIDDDAKTLEVTYRGDNYYEHTDRYTGSVSIPKKVIMGQLTYTVERIGEFAFADCGGLTEIEMQNNITSIGELAFYNCYNLANVTIPHSVTSIESYAFHTCASLTSVVIPYSVTRIVGNVFAACYELASITVDSGNTVYDSRNDCNAIIEKATNTLIAGCENTVIPNSVTKIGSEAFMYFKFENMTIPNGVTSIGGQAFYYCTNLTSIEIPNSVTSIGYAAFEGCWGLTSIEIPNSVTSIGEYAFRNTGLYMNQSDGLFIKDGWLLGYKGDAPTGELVIPNSVTSIGNGVFYGCSGLTSIEIPNSVTSIGRSAFDDCSGLTSITIPNSVTSIGDYAFNGCSGLTSIEIPNSVESIGYAAFASCASLTSVKIGNGVTAIGGCAFLACSSLASVTIGNSVTSIEGNAFDSCVNLKKVINLSNLDIVAGSYEHGWVAYYADEVINPLDSKFEIGGIYYTVTDKAARTVEVTYQGDDCGEYNEYVGDVVIPETISYYDITFNVTSIGDEAFRGCDSMTSLSIPNSVTKIGEYALTGCTALTNLHIPASVESIEESAFSGCWVLESLTVDSNNSVYDSRNNCNAIVETASNTLIAGCMNTVVPKTVTSIGDNAFRGCVNLTDIKFHNAITSIGIRAFSGCGKLTSIILPSGIESISENAFAGCSAINLVVNYSDLEITAGAETYGSVALNVNKVWTEYPIFDGKDYAYEDIKDYAKFNYVRTFANTTDWEPWYMPFDVELSDIENELEVACLNNIDQYDDDNDGKIDRTEIEAIPFVEGTLLANYPYIVKAKTAGEKEFVLKNVTVQPYENNSIDCSSVATKFTFTGINNAVEYNSSYYALKNNLLSAATISMYMSNGEVASLSQLSNDKVYTLRSARTFLLYSSNADVADKLCTGNGKKVGDVSRDANDANQHFKIENINGNYYLYSVAAGKYVSKDGTFVATPTDALTFENVGGEYQWKLHVGGNCLNSQDRDRIDAGILVDDWTTTDAGNCYIIEEVIPMLAPNRWYLNIEARNSSYKAPANIRLYVRGVNNDGDDSQTSIESVEMGDEKGESRNEKGESRNEKGEIYDLAGRKVTNPGKGIYIVNGKRVLIK